MVPHTRAFFTVMQQVETIAAVLDSEVGDTTPRLKIKVP
jgi:hypothetical protein